MRTTRDFQLWERREKEEAGCGWMDEMRRKELMFERCKFADVDGDVRNVASPEFQLVAVIYARRVSCSKIDSQDLE